MKTMMLQPSVLPEGGVAYTIFVKTCVQFILEALIVGMIPYFIIPYGTYFLTPSHVRGLGLGLG